MKSWEQKLVKTEQGELKAFDPITKELSDVGSGGSGGGGDSALYVILTNVEGFWTADKTSDEIYSALEHGIPVYVYVEGLFCSLMTFYGSADVWGAVFTGFYIDSFVDTAESVGLTITRVDIVYEEGELFEILVAITNGLSIQ